jgi:membrane associated rhomboid family serine protease
MVKKILKASERTFRFIALLWWVFLIDCTVHWLTGYSICNLGLLPRTGQGLLGILTMPFLHGNLVHITTNTLSLATVLILLYLEFKPRAVNATIFKTVIASGILLWIFGRSNGMHIGASALVYGLITYTAVVGFTKHRASLVAYSIAMLFFNSGFFMGLLPLDTKVSWEGHLMGAIAGIIVALGEGKSDLDRHHSDV